MEGITYEDIENAMDYYGLYHMGQAIEKLIELKKDTSNEVSNASPQVAEES